MRSIVIISSITIIAAVLLAAGAATHAAPVMPIATGHVSSKPDEPVQGRPAGGACMWPVPGQLQMVNLYALQSVTVVEDKAFGSGRKTYKTHLNFGFRQNIEIDIWQTGADPRVHMLSIEARLKECSK
jgi:hypothetical protein